MRTIKELLQLLLDNPGHFRTGLCGWAASLEFVHIMSTEEYQELHNYIKVNRPYKYFSITAWEQRNSGFFWPMEEFEPRIKWINKHIKKLK